MTSRDTKKILVIITNVRHYEMAGQIFASGPYTLEIQPWAEIFERVYIAAPLRKNSPPSDCLTFTNSNISVIPQTETGGRTLKEKFLNIINVPNQVIGLTRAMQKGNYIQIRCPCNLGLLGSILAPLFSRYLIANYAAQWNSFAGEPLSYRLQRLILRSFWWRNGLVTVYGEWPNQPRQIIPFFTSTMTAKQVEHGTKAARYKCLTFPVHILFVGRVVPGKGIDVLLQASTFLLKKNIPFKLSIVGDGHDRARLEAIVQHLGLEKNVHFVGALPYEEVMSWYEKAHLLVLPSKSEGWGKVLLEAMCYGVVCLATDTGPIPWILKDRGFIFPYGAVEALANKVQWIMENPTTYQDLSRAASDWAQNYSIEGVQEAYKRILWERWSYTFVKK